MNWILVIIGIIVFGFIINVLLKQSYNFVFFLGKKPKTWIIICGIIAILAWWLSASFNWSVSIPAWSSLIGFLLNIPPKNKDPKLQKELDELSEESYKNIGIPNGKFLYRVGLGVFIAVCVLSWLLFYTQIQNV